MRHLLLTAPLAFALGGTAAVAQAQTAAAPYHLLGTIPIGGEGAGIF